MALTLREYTASFFLAGFVITAALTFAFSAPDSLDSQYGMNVDSGELSNLESKISENQASRQNLSNSARGVSVEQTSGFISGLKSALTIITTSLATLTALPAIAFDITDALGIPDFIGNLVYIPLVAVAYEVVTILVGVRT